VRREWDDLAPETAHEAGAEEVEGVEVGEDEDKEFGGEEAGGYGWAKSFFGAEGEGEGRHVRVI